MNILNQINENEYLKIKVKDLKNDLAKEQNKAQYFKKAQKIIEELETKLEITEKALALLKYPPNYYRFVNENTETIDVDLAISKAKEMMKSE